MKQYILKSPDLLVRTVCTPVTEFDFSLKQLALDLIESLRASTRPGVGLSANQIGCLLRVFVIDEGAGVRQMRSDIAHVFVNPTIRTKRGLQRGVEGCLSLEPADDCLVTRAEIIKWDAQDLDGNPISGKMSKKMARIFQHEMDHLDGILIVDKEKK